MQHSTITRIGAAALIAGLVSFSSAGFAQQEALEALNAQAEADQTDAAANSHHALADTLADTLAADLDAYNRQDNFDRGPSTHMPQDHTPQRVTHRIQRLAADLDAYNAAHTHGRLPQTHVPASEVAQSVDYSRADNIAHRLARFNESGGDLSSVQNLN